MKRNKPRAFSPPRAMESSSVIYPRIIYYSSAFLIIPLSLSYQFGQKMKYLGGKWRAATNQPNRGSTEDWLMHVRDGSNDAFLSGGTAALEKSIHSALASLPCWTGSLFLATKCSRQLRKILKVDFVSSSPLIPLICCNSHRVYEKCNNFSAVSSIPWLLKLSSPHPPPPKSQFISTREIR